MIRSPARSRVRLPDFPWDHLVPFKEKARAHPYGLVDLSVGTPVDPTPAVAQHALAAAADAPGYPPTYGTDELRDAAAGWLARRLGVLVDPSAVLPVLGTKELVAQLPSQLGLEPGDRVWVPTPAYPTYEVGALLARCEPVLGPTDGVTLVWLNSPANPSGRVLTVEEMRAVVTWARERGVIVASDECYIELGWEARPVSVLHPDVCGGSHEGLLAVHSLSKRSNLAGYRAGFVAGDPELVNGLLQLRKHAGMIMPQPVQAAMAAALADDAHVADQRARYANRRNVLAAALTVAGFTIDHSEAGLYLWATRGEDCWATVDALASVGILVAPGSFYGEAGRRHVRVALTAPDAQIATVPERMTMLPPPGSGPGPSPAYPQGGQPRASSQPRPAGHPGMPGNAAPAPSGGPAGAPMPAPAAHPGQLHTGQMNVGPMQTGAVPTGGMPTGGMPTGAVPVGQMPAGPAPAGPAAGHGGHPGPATGGFARPGSFGPADTAGYRVNADQGGYPAGGGYDYRVDQQRAGQQPVAQHPADQFGQHRPEQAAGRYQPREQYSGDQFGAHPFAGNGQPGQQPLPPAATGQMPVAGAEGGQQAADPDATRRWSPEPDIR